MFASPLARGSGERCKPPPWDPGRGPGDLADLERCIDFKAAPDVDSPDVRFISVKFSMGSDLLKIPQPNFAGSALQDSNGIGVYGIKDVNLVCWQPLGFLPSEEKP